MKQAHRIGIPPGLRVLYIERHEGRRRTLRRKYPERMSTASDVVYDIKVEGHYRLWLHRALSNALLGTYLALWDNGKIERVTVRADEGDQVDLIKPED